MRDVLRMGVLVWPGAMWCTLPAEEGEKKEEERQREREKEREREKDVSHSIKPAYNKD